MSVYKVEGSQTSLKSTEITNQSQTDRWRTVSGKPPINKIPKIKLKKIIKNTYKSVSTFHVVCKFSL